MGHQPYEDAAQARSGKFIERADGQIALERLRSTVPLVRQCVAGY